MLETKGLQEHLPDIWRRKCPSVTGMKNATLEHDKGRKVRTLKEIGSGLIGREIRAVEVIIS